ncbi:MAG: hypothetical protein ACXWBM_03510 [Chthoniobacterales bacterium]
MRITFVLLSILLFSLATDGVAGPSTVREWNGVRVFSVAPEHFGKIAIVQGRSIEELRSKAAAVGANGLIASGVVRHNAPVIGMDFGTSNFHSNRHRVYGFDTGTSFDAPTGADILQGTAIYVP